MGLSVGSVAIPLLRGFSWILGLQPSWMLKVEGDSLGALLRLLKLRAKIVEQNLAIAYPGSENLEQRNRLYGESYRSLGRLILEVLLLFGPMKRFVQTRSELRGAENWRAAKEAGKGVLFLSSHVGNWEIMAATGAIHAGMDLMIVTKHLKPEWLHRTIEEGRRRCGVDATYEPRTLKDVLAHLKRNGTVGFVLDQYAGAPVGVRVPFFGVPVGTMTALAMLARRTGAKVLPVVNYRLPGGRHVVEIRPALEWVEGASGGEASQEEEIARNTARYAEEMERDVRSHPEQWLWIHRRFKGDLSPLRKDEWSQGRPRQ